MTRTPKRPMTRLRPNIELIIDCNSYTNLKSTYKKLAIYFFGLFTPRDVIEHHCGHYDFLQTLHENMTQKAIIAIYTLDFMLQAHKNKTWNNLGDRKIKELKEDLLLACNHFEELYEEFSKKSELYRKTYEDVGQV